MFGNDALRLTNGVWVAAHCAEAPPVSPPGGTALAQP